MLANEAPAKETVVFDWKVAAPQDIKVGDLVFRRGDGPWTDLFINASSREKRFSHVGIVVSNSVEVIILHADANDLTGVGKVRLVDWRGFFSNACECGVYRFKGSEVYSAAWAKKAELFLGVPFDFEFDQKTTNRFYCTEIVQYVINKTLLQPLIGTTKICGREIVAIDDVYHSEFTLVQSFHDPPRPVKSLGYYDQFCLLLKGVVFLIDVNMVCCLLAVILVALGVIGCVAPILPGPILAYAALFCLIPTDDSPSVAAFVILGILTVVVTIADSVIPAIGAKKFDCSRWGTWGCFIGTIVGVFFFPIGLVAGPFLGAFLGELLAGKTAHAALRGGVGALLGFLAGTVLKLAVSIAIAVAVIMRLF